MIPSGNHTRSHRAAGIDQFWVLRHTAIKDNLFRGNTKTKIFVPTITQCDLIGSIFQNIRFISQTQISMIPTAGDNWVHFFSYKVSTIAKLL